MMNRLTSMQGALGSFQDKVGAMEDADKAKYKAVLDLAKTLSKKLVDLKDSVYNSEVQKDAIEDDIHFLQKLDTQLQFMTYAAYGDPQPILQSVQDIDAELTPKLNDAIAKFNVLLQKDVVDYNKAAFATGAPTLMVGEAVAIKPAPSF
jgi:hypothetical protein